MGFSRKEYWSWLPCPSPEDLPDPEIKPVSYISCIAGRFFTARATSGMLKSLTIIVWLSVSPFMSVSIYIFKCSCTGACMLMSIISFSYISLLFSLWPFLKVFFFFSFWYFYPCFLVISICMKYIFSIPSLSVFLCFTLKWVSCRQQTAGSFFFFNPISHTVFLHCNILSTDIQSNYW